ncbi:MAG: hypothetical protein GF364_07595 [Candidatus Lokiarchaeota archaeon]|nr:hypothetical protein [Candidatus Lokiarchaeota archaeon]
MQEKNNKNDLIETEHYERYIEKIESDLNQLLKHLNQDPIPTREEMVLELQKKILSEFYIIKNSQKGKNHKKSAKSPQKSLKTEIINKIKELQNNPERKKEIISDIINSIPNIAEEDRNVLIHSLFESSSKELKSAIENLIQIFNPAEENST